MCGICPKLTIKTPERLYWRRFGVFVVNFELVNFSCSSVPTVDFKLLSVNSVDTLDVARGMQSLSSYDIKANTYKKIFAKLCFIEIILSSYYFQRHIESLRNI